MNEEKNNKDTKVAEFMGKFLANVLVVCVGVGIAAVLVALTIGLVKLLF